MRGEPTPVWDSGNITVWEEYFDVVLVVANSLVLFITSVVGIAANTFVILAVCRQKSLQTSVNALVVNLAVVDFLRCVVDCPVLLNIITTVHRRGQVDSLVCDTQMASFSFSCCVQLLTLAFISAERYQAIAKPFEAKQRKKRIRTLIPLTWTLAVLVAVFCQIFLRDSPVYVRCQGWQRRTLPSYNTIGLYVLLPLWAACFGLITGFYTSIFALVRSHNRKIFDKGISPPTKDSAEDKQNKGETTVMENGPEQILSVALTQPEPNQFKKKSPLTSGEAPQSESISSEGKTEFKNVAEMSHLETDRPHPLAGQVEEKPLKAESCSPTSTKAETEPSNQDPAANVQGSNTEAHDASTNFNTENLPRESLRTDTASKETSLRVVQPEQRDDPEAASFLMTDLKQENNSNKDEAHAAPSADQTPSPPPDPNNEAMQLEGAVCIMPSKASKERARKKNESKMAKRAGYIIITFLLFWLPLLTSILVNFVVHKNRNPQKLIIQDLEILSVSVTCITSLSDPIIYAAVNPQFRAEFYKLKRWVKSRFNKN
ncbi:dopamine D2-like receptor [Kryptolebias marmoratus]|uniref:dopamine D2-like receptor n=1 Tax=Kryptolebias marmoratus TaxID=37003 RepID=UPI0007F8CD2B|nr:dopamine D2-like receptor [Kryptolebias marmoratus]